MKPTEIMRRLERIPGVTKKEGGKHVIFTGYGFSLTIGRGTRSSSYRTMAARMKTVRLMEEAAAHAAEEAKCEES